MEEFNELKVRGITAEGLEKLDREELVYVKQDFEQLTLAPAHILKTAGDGGFFPYVSIFGEENLTPLDGIFVEDEAGDTARIIRSAGTRVSLSLFFPGMEENVLSDLYSVLRDKFGAGVVERWAESVNLVPAVKYDVYEVVTVKQGRGKTREEHDTRILRASGVLKDQSLTIEAQSGGNLVVEPHKPIVHQVSTI